MLATCSVTSAHAADPKLREVKVDPWVRAQVDSGQAEFLVFLRDQADLAPAKGLTTKEGKGRFVFDALRDKASSTQGPVIRVLEALGVHYQSFWIANMLLVRGGAAVVEAMAAHPAVAGVHANPRVAADRPQVVSGRGPEASSGIEWNIGHVGAPAVWVLGFRGQGVVVGGQDTGYDWEHPALIGQYRGWDGGAADHDYNWHDAIHAGGGICGADSPFPCDDYGHGTHTMGTMVGDDGGDNRIGVAPDARWIGCRNMDQGVGTPASYAECYQWFVAPTRIDGSDPDPSMAPRVINNSWGCPPSEGCTDPTVLLTLVENVRAAGILTVHSAGNEGPSCSTVANPAAIYDAAYTVAATDSNDQIAGFSSRGPVTADGSGRMKPDISAPGVEIRSSVPGGGYQSGWSGTSMAAPHVAGLVALAISAEPALAGQVEQLETNISQSAVPLTSVQGCGGDGETDVPNNVYGWGRIDALATVSAQPPIPEIRIKDSDGPISVHTGDPLSVEISLDPGVLEGKMGEQWLQGARKLGGWEIRMYYDPDPGRWRLRPRVLDQGTLETVPETTVLDALRLPPGKYWFSYGIDVEMDGRPSGSLVEDRIEVTVTR